MKPKSLQELVPFEITPQNASRFAERIVDSAREVDGVELDYSVASLEEVNQILMGFRNQKKVPKVLDIAVTLFEFGCYVGEVLVRNNSGSEWAMLPDDETESPLNSGLVVELPKGTTANPIGKVVKRFENGEGDDLVYFYRMVLSLEKETDEDPPPKS
jgi:hypothetical protein